MTILSKTERFLLEWLSKEDASSFGECKGADLSILVHHGLAQIGPVPPGRDSNYRAVSLTEAGFAALSPPSSPSAGEEGK